MYIINKIIASEKSVSDPGLIQGKIPEVEDIVDDDSLSYENDDDDIEFDPFSLESTGIDAEVLDDNAPTGDD